MKEVHQKISSNSSFGYFETPEQCIPDMPLVDQYNNTIPWETCLTLNDFWGYNEQDKNWKTPELMVHSLVNCVSKNGNLLLNVEPEKKIKHRHFFVQKHTSKAVLLRSSSFESAK